MEFSQIGYFVKAHGVKGHLILKEEAGVVWEGLNALFLEGATGKAPYFVSDLRDTNNGLIVKLEGVDAVEQAKSLVGKPVYAESKFVEEEEQGADWLGYEVIDRQMGLLGKVTAVSSNGMQDLLSMNYRGKELILPLVEEFVEKVDEGSKKIWYNAPEGLIDLYLSGEE